MSIVGAKKNLYIQNCEKSVKPVQKENLQFKNEILLTKNYKLILISLFILSLIFLLLIIFVNIKLIDLYFPFINYIFSILFSSCFSFSIGLLFGKVL